MFFSIPNFIRVTFLTTITLSCWLNPVWAGDPFRSQNPHKIGTQTEAAFKAIFEQGDYPATERYLEKALKNEPKEPLAYAMKASLAYGNHDWPTLNKYSQKIQETGQKLIATDPLRGNLYTAVGIFFQGAAGLLQQGTISGVGTALGKLNQVYAYLDKAEAIDPHDPEFNLIRGYMDLMLAVNLPFASPEQAIARLEENGAPKYLVIRGVTLAYRDLKDYSQALTYANQAVGMTENNPEIYYLRAQIRHEKGYKEKNKELLKEAISDFETALGKKSQLPPMLVKQIQREHDLAVSRRNSL